MVRSTVQRNITSVIFDDVDQKVRQQILGLTVAKDFESRAEQIKAKRERMKEDNKNVTVYEGQVPLHQRLILLCQDFLESTWDFDL